MPKATPLEHIRARVSVTSAGCWEWNGYRTADGYGKATLDGRRGELVHRWSYQRLVGPIADGLEIDHICGNRSCCNPAHLEPVTHAENVRRGRRAQQTHCKHGHPLTPESVKIDSRGRRNCRACHREQSRRAYRAKMERASE